MTFTRRGIRASAVLCAAAVGGALMVGAPASAEPRPAADGGWTVTPGGAFTVSGGMTVTDEVYGVQWVCGTPYEPQPVTALGTLMAGSVPTGQGVGEWSSVEGFYCGGPLDWNLNFTAGDMPWHLDATSYAPATDTTTGTLTGLSLHAVGSAATADFDGPGGPGSGTGSVTFSYDNATHQLTLTGGNMEAYNVHGAIIGLLNDGDPVDFGTTMPVTPAQTIRPDGVTG